MLLGSKKISLCVFFLLFLVTTIHAEIKLDSTYEYFNCTLIKMDFEKVIGYNYAKGVKSPLKIVLTYKTEKADTLAINQYYIWYKFEKEELKDDGSIDDDYMRNLRFKDSFFSIGSKYYIKFRAESLYDLYSTLLSVRNHIPCEYHIVNRNKFRWQKDKRKLKTMKCRKVDFSYFVSDIENTVIKLDLHDAKYPGSSVTDW